MTTDLAIRDSDATWSPEQLAVLRHMGVEGAPQAELQVFHHQSKRTGLDPFSKQIYMLSRRQKNRQGQWETKWTIQTGIDGYRLTGHRAAKRDGVTLGYGPTEWCGPDGVWREVWASAEPPVAARATVLRDGQPFPAVAHYDEYAQKDGQGNVNAMWRRMARGQLAKCAEALALRKAFPADLAGVYTDAEMHQAAAEDRSEDELREEMRKRMGWLIKQVDLSAADALRVASEHAGREVTNSRQLTAEELATINEALESLLADQVSTAPAEAPAEDVVDAQVVDDQGVNTETGEVQMITDHLQRRQRAQRRDLGLEGDDGGPQDQQFWGLLSGWFGREFTSSTQQTEAEALEACRRMQAMLENADPEQEGASQ
jgi:phage recombination protein Bet